MELSGDKKLKKGEWRVWSETDPRWEATGNNPSSREAQKEGQEAVEKLKQELGDPPEDVLWVHKVN
jgi:hypothetical protein